jgi:hypothetical protein
MVDVWKGKRAKVSIYKIANPIWESSACMIYLPLEGPTFYAITLSSFKFQLINFGGTHAFKM